MSKNSEKSLPLDTDKKDEDKAFELAAQLHRQYAEADSSKSGNLIATIGALFTIFAGYGYVFMNYPCEAGGLILFGATVLTVFVLFRLMKITAFHGYALRRDEVIVYRIRRKYMKESGIFNFANNTKGAYNPIRKIMNGKDILPDYYSILYSTFSHLIYLVIGATALRFASSCSACWNKDCICGCCKAFECCVAIIALAVAFVFVVISSDYIKCRYCRKLQDMLTEAEKAEAEK